MNQDRLAKTLFWLLALVVLVCSVAFGTAAGSPPGPAEPAIVVIFLIWAIFCINNGWVWQTLAAFAFGIAVYLLLYPNMMAGFGFALAPIILIAALPSRKRGASGHWILDTEYTGISTPQQPGKATDYQIIKAETATTSKAVRFILPVRIAQPKLSAEERKRIKQERAKASTGVNHWYLNTWLLLATVLVVGIGGIIYW